MSCNTQKNFTCKICNKSYSSKQSIWNHNNKYHSGKNSETSSTKMPQITTGLPQNTTNLPQNSTKLCEYTCQYCNKSLSRHDSLKRHEVKCKISWEKKQNILKEENTYLKEALNKQFEENTQIKSLLTELLNKNCKVHPKTLQKINKQLNGDNNTINENNITNNNNNITNNNTFNVIALGHENLTEVFSKKEKMNILKYKYGSLPQLVEYAHFNDKYPQFKNILITNTQNTIGYKYNEKKKQYVATKKDDLLEDIVDARMCDINSFYEELEGELDEKTKDILDKLKEQIEKDSAYRDLKKNDIKLIIYNNRKKVTKEIKDNSDIEV